MRRLKEITMISVFLRLPDTSRERLKDNQAQKKGHDGACAQVWHTGMGMKCIKLSLRTFGHRHDTKKYIHKEWCQVNRLGQYTLISTLLPSVLISAPSILPYSLYCSLVLLIHCWKAFHIVLTSNRLGFTGCPSNGWYFWSLYSLDP